MMELTITLLRLKNLNKPNNIQPKHLLKTLCHTIPFEIKIQTCIYQPCALS